MDRPGTLTAGGALRVALEHLAPDDVIVAMLARSCEDGVNRIAELSELTAAKKRLTQQLLQRTESLDTASDMLAIAAERDGLLASIDARILAYGRATRQTIRLIREWSPKPTKTTLPRLSKEFRSNKGCEEYLALYHRRTGTHCPSCDRDTFAVLHTRPVLQCMDCDRQLPLRHSTVMAKSRLPLTIWFAAMQAVIAIPHVTCEHLAEHLGLQRIETARTMRRKILRALDSSNRKALLAGLDDYFTCPPAVSAHSAQLQMGSQNALPSPELSPSQGRRCGAD